MNFSASGSLWTSAHARRGWSACGSASVVSRATALGGSARSSPFDAFLVWRSAWNSGWAPAHKSRSVFGSVFGSWDLSQVSCERQIACGSVSGSLCALLSWRCQQSTLPVQRASPPLVPVQKTEMEPAWAFLAPLGATRRPPSSGAEWKHTASSEASRSRGHWHQKRPSRTPLIVCIKAPPP